MSSKKSKKARHKTDHEAKSRIGEDLEHIIAEANEQEHPEAYFIRKAKELRSLDEACTTWVIRRFQKSSSAEKDILLKLMRHFKGVEHIAFFQEFIKRGGFLPRTGMAILELFTKSDAILESGHATRILDYDNLMQRIKQAAIGSSVSDQLINEYAALSEEEREGIVYQLVDEAGVHGAPFLISLIAQDKKAAQDAVAVIRKMQSLKAFDVLEVLYNKTKSKDIEKTLKKTAHALKQKGLEVDFQPVVETKSSVLKKVVLPESRAFISKIDAEGFRLVFLIKPVSAYENKIFSIMINDFRGIHNTEVTNAFRKETNIFIERLYSDARFEFMEAKPEDALFLIEEACRTTESGGKTVSASIEQLKSAFPEGSGSRMRPSIYDMFDEETVRRKNGLADKIPELFNKTDVSFWYILSQEAKENWIKMTNILYSPIVLNDTQKKERMYGLYVDTARAFFREERCRAFKRRLEELACILHAKGESEAAEVALYAAITITASDFKPEGNSFCMTMIYKGFKFFESTYRDADGTRAGGVIDPKDFSLIA